MGYYYTIPKESRFGYHPNTNGDMELKLTKEAFLNRLEYVLSKSGGVLHRYTEKFRVSDMGVLSMEDKEQMNRELEALSREEEMGTENTVDEIERDGDGLETPNFGGLFGVL